MANVNIRSLIYGFRDGITDRVVPSTRKVTQVDTLASGGYFARTAVDIFQWSVSQQDRQTAHQSTQSYLAAA